MRILLLLTFAITTLIADDFDYVGTKKCSKCHKSKKKGAQYKKWQEGPHAGAFESLKSEKALATAKEEGITGNPWEAPECLKCHTTGFGDGGYTHMDAAFWDEKTEEGKPTKAVKRMAALQSVGCEACHGPGSKYKSKKKMKAIYEGTMDGAALGLWTPDEKVCSTCHNEESPTYKEFVFEERIKDVQHPFPAEMPKK